MLADLFFLDTFLDLFFFLFSFVGTIREKEKMIKSLYKQKPNDAECLESVERKIDLNLQALLHHFLKIKDLSREPEKLQKKV